MVARLMIGFVLFFLFGQCAHGQTDFDDRISEVIDIVEQEQTKKARESLERGQGLPKDIKPQHALTGLHQYNAEQDRKRQARERQQRERELERQRQRQRQARELEQQRQARELERRQAIEQERQRQALREFQEKRKQQKRARELERQRQAHLALQGEEKSRFNSGTMDEENAEKKDIFFLPGDPNAHVKFSYRNGRVISCSYVEDGAKEDCKGYVGLVREIEKTL